jgi:hypothetical protein
LLALGELCIFGQQFAPARSALLAYLAIPQLPERQLAVVLLIRALLGLKELDGADLQIDSLLRDYPYDAQTHFAIDQVIEAREAAAPSLSYTRPRALKNCATQSEMTLPLLASTSGLEGKEISASPSALFIDAVRCAALQQELGEPSGKETMQKLAAIVQQPSWSGRADLPLMQAALARQQMVGTRTPEKVLHGHVLQNGSLVPRSVSLAHATVLLVTVSVWAPSALEMVRDLTRLLPQTPMYAITSWSANTGGHDIPSDPILQALKSFQQSSPRHIPLLIVPQPVLNAFYVDSFPAGIVIRDGSVRFNGVLFGRGAEHVLVHALTDHGR